MICAPATQGRLLETRGGAASALGPWAVPLSFWGGDGAPRSCPLSMSGGMILPWMVNVGAVRDTHNV